MTGITLRLRCCASRPNNLSVRFVPSRALSSSSFSISRRPTLRKEPPPSTASPSSFFTPSLCRSSPKRYASSAKAEAGPVQGNPAQPTENLLLDWNSFFRLRTSRRRYALASSIVCAIGTTGATFVFLSTQPEMAEDITKLVPTDPFISMGILTFGATLFGWLIGPTFGNAIWRMFHRTKLPEFTLKEKTFFERIKRHRVNPTGASTNNPVPDFYGEKINSVSGYRRWLKDQRAFNRKKEGIYNSRV